MKFTELPLSKEVLQGTIKAGFESCTKVQEDVLPTSLTSKDVMVQSKTGSGKTAVFLLTIFENYIRAKKEGKTSPVALVVAPTRELAVQIEKDAILLASGLGEDFKIGCFYGGVGYQQQTDEIKSGLSLYVGTPGRLLDFGSSHKIDFRTFDIIVLDEADRMFDMGFLPDIQKMFNQSRLPKERQTMLFSATLSTKVRNLAWSYMNEPKEIEVEPEEITVNKIDQILFHVTKEEKFGLLLKLMKKLNPSSALIFTNTKDMAVEVSKRLSANNYKSAYLMGDMAQSERLKTLTKMQEGKISILVATDVAARGLQIDDLALVVNYDIPEDPESYVHRIGRTARAGKSGKAVTLGCEKYIYGLEAIEEYIQMKVPVVWEDEFELEEVEDLSKDINYHKQRNNNTSRKPNSNGKSQYTKGKPAYDKKPYAKKEYEKKPYKKAEGDKKPYQKKDYDSKSNYEKKPYSKQQSTKKPYDKTKQTKNYEKISNMSLEERMAYYKKQYTPEESKVKKQTTVQPDKKKGFLAKIKEFFKRK